LPRRLQWRFDLHQRIRRGTDQRRLTHGEPRETGDEFRLLASAVDDRKWRSPRGVHETDCQAQRD
jgi:hypothetical protein